MTPSENTRKHRFVVLDGLRGGAAIMVVITHTSNFAPLAYLVVGFFYMLSGFVLAYSSAKKLQQSGPPGRVAKIRFSVGRLIRLYPLYAAGTAIALLPAIGFIWLRFDHWTWKEFVLALL